MPERVFLLALLGWLVGGWTCAGQKASDGASDPKVLTFGATGIVKEIKADDSTLVVQHDAISNYMGAMTMPFRVKDVPSLSSLHKGDRISFSLHVTDHESWIDHLAKIDSVSREEIPPASPASANGVAAGANHHPLLDFKFTNELGRRVSLRDFQGQALAITFFFTRCPIPDYCPRLSRNFQEASRKLSALPNGPTNWHFLSVSFDTKYDTVPVLKAYAESYHYDPSHWSFLTGPDEQIAELARLSDVKVDAEGGLFSHNFRTLIVDAAGRLQMSFPIGGDLSEAIVEQICHAAKATSVTQAAGLKTESGNHAR
jgi:protein SCO1/2